MSKTRVIILISKLLNELRCPSLLNCYLLLCSTVHYHVNTRKAFKRASNYGAYVKLSFQMKCDRGNINRFQIPVLSLKMYYLDELWWRLNRKKEHSKKAGRTTEKT